MVQARSESLRTGLAGQAETTGSNVVTRPGLGSDRGRDRGHTTATLPSLPGNSFPARGDRELADDLAGLAASLHQVDPRSAERLDDLANAVSTPHGRQRWADVDLRRAFNTERLAHAFAVRHEGGYASRGIDWADRVRNVLVLIPIFLTWFAFSEASKAYDAYLTSHPNDVGTPFLLLWQRGFGGDTGIFAPTFSTVAMIDAVIIFAIIALTVYSHGRREARDDAIATTANEFQTDLDNVLAEATVSLAASRSSGPALMSQVAERFDRGSQELLTRLRVEQDRLEAVASRREREFQDFGVFASGMRAGAEETRRLLIELSRVSNGLQSALEDLTSEVGVSGEQQRTLLNAVHALERSVASGIQSDQAVVRQLSDAASSLTDTADKALSGADAAAQAGRVATEAVRGIADIAAGLAASQSRVESALAGESEANARLADAFRSGAGGVAASARTLNEIGAGLSQLRQEFARLNQQSAQQASSLSEAISQQHSVVSVLLNRLDALTNLLSRATTTLPTADNLQQAFTAALRSELSHQTDVISDVLDGRPPRPAQNRGTSMWPSREPRR